MERILFFIVMLIIMISRNIEIYFRLIFDNPIPNFPKHYQMPYLLITTLAMLVLLRNIKIELKMFVENIFYMESNFSFLKRKFAIINISTKYLYNDLLIFIHNEREKLFTLHKSKISHFTNPKYYTIVYKINIY